MGYRLALLLWACLTTAVHGMEFSPNRWEYEVRANFSPSTERMARLLSQTAVALPGPYESLAHAQIVLVRTTRETPAVRIRVLPAGDLRCPTSGCKVTMRFDDLPPESWPAAFVPGDRSGLVLGDEARFFSRLKHSRTMTIDLDIFDAGAYRFEFDSAGLRWR